MFYYNVKAVSCEVSFGLSAVTKSYNFICSHLNIAILRIISLTGSPFSQCAVQAPHSIQSSAAGSFALSSLFKLYKLNTFGMSIPAGHTSLHFPHPEQAFRSNSFCLSIFVHLTFNLSSIFRPFEIHAPTRANRQIIEAKSTKKHNFDCAKSKKTN